MHTSPAPAKPSVSQILAAKRAAKAEKQQARAAKSISKTDSNQAARINAKIAAQQRANIIALHQSPPLDEEGITNSIILLWLNFAEMRRVHRWQTQKFAEQMLLQVKRISELDPTYSHALKLEISQHCREGHEALKQWVREFDNLSPNQRDEVLRPLQTVFSIMGDMLETIATDVLHETTAYTVAVRTIISAYQFFHLPYETVFAIGEVINGKDSRAAARSIGMPYNQFTATALLAGNLIYDIIDGEVPHDLEQKYGMPAKHHRPQSISDLRQPIVQIAANTNTGFIKSTVASCERFITDRNYITGITSYSMAKHEQRRQELRKKANKEHADFIQKYRKETK